MDVVYTIAAFASILGLFISILYILGHSPKDMPKEIRQAFSMWKIQRRFKQKLSEEELRKRVKSNYEKELPSDQVVGLLQSKELTRIGHFRTFDYHFNVIINILSTVQDSYFQLASRALANDLANKGILDNVSALAYLKNELNDLFSLTLGKELPIQRTSYDSLYLKD